MRIAIVGTGISGLGAAYVLAPAHEVELFERDGRVGGHTNTVAHAGLGLDTGFIVHNEPNYPFLCRLFRELGVATQDSSMSLSVSAGGFEYSGTRPFAQPRNALRPRFWGLLWEIGRWLRTARPPADETTLDAYLVAEGYSADFRRYFAVPLCSALWSTDPGETLDFPAAYAIRFFENHGMLGFRRFRWRTVTGGSDTYVRALRERLGDRIRLDAEVRAVRRDEQGVELTTADGTARRFDKVVIATHADQALRLLADPSDDERRLLGAFRYTSNDTVLHTDERFLPRTRAARASWNYQVTGRAGPTVTYYLNRLQRLDGPDHYCVTLNRTEEIAPERVLARFRYEHPVYTLETLRAQRELPSLSGPRHTAYAGAHHGHGFHEDGLASGVAAARALGVEW
jgi:predicted NAD/FAD-binding protein